MVVQVYIMDKAKGEISVSSYATLSEAFDDIAKLSDCETLWFRIENGCSVHCPQCGSTETVYNRFLDSMVCPSCQCIVEHREVHQ